MNIQNVNVWESGHFQDVYEKNKVTVPSCVSPVKMSMFPNSQMKHDISSLLFITYVLAASIANDIPAEVDRVNPEEWDLWMHTGI